MDIPRSEIPEKPQRAERLRAYGRDGMAQRGKRHGAAVEEEGQEWCCWRRREYTQKNTREKRGSQEKGEREEGKEEGGRNSIPPHPKQPQEAKVSLIEEEKTSLLERRKSFSLMKERSKIEDCFDNFVSQSLLL
jgi:hypothetical protein